MSPDSWFNRHKNTAILVPGGGDGNAGQCVQAMDSYLYEVYGKPYVYAAGALDIWNGTLLDKLGLSRIRAGQLVLPGDFVFFSASVGAVQGHVDIASRAGTPTDFYAYDSNWGGAAFKNAAGYPLLHEVRHNDIYNNYIVGYYRIPAGKGAEAPKEAAMPYITDAALQDYQAWKAKALDYQNSVIPAMEADKQAWIANYTAIQKQLQQLQTSVADTLKLQTTDTKLVSSVVPTAKTSVLAKVASWLTSNKA